MFHTDKWILFHYFSNCNIFLKVWTLAGQKTPRLIPQYGTSLKWCIQICVE